MKALAISAATSLLVGLGAAQALKLPDYMSAPSMAYQIDAQGAEDPNLAAWKAKVRAEGVHIGPTSLYVPAYAPPLEPVYYGDYDLDAALADSNRDLRRDLAALDAEIAANRQEMGWRQNAVQGSVLRYDASLPETGGAVLPYRPAQEEPVPASAPAEPERYTSDIAVELEAQSEAREVEVALAEEPTPVFRWDYRD